METNTHKILDILEHIWPYVSGFFITMFAAIRLWWHDRKETKKRIARLEILAENTVTKADLHSCREEVREVDENNLEKLYQEIKDSNKQNAQEHRDIMGQMLRLHSMGENNDN